ncbi:MAG: malectin domain-containing carbohydrate-binding protein, partial [Chitinophagaceae bacterium]
VATGTSSNVNILVRPSGLNDNFGFVWEGYINIPVAGTYTFETVSDDGSKLYYNSFYSPSAIAVVNNDGLHAAISATGAVAISDKGMHPIAITFYDRTGGEFMQVYWSGPGIPRQLIPNVAFTESLTNQLPVSSAGPDKTITLPVNSSTLDGSGTDADGTIGSYTWTQVSGPNTATFSSKIIAAPSLSGLVVGSYVFSLVVTDNQSAASAADQVSVNVAPASTNTPVYRINSGGAQVTNSIGTFAADAFYSPTPGDIASTTNAIAGTADDAIYQTVRYGSTGTLNYTFPVTNGQYTVILHFAEVYFNAVNNRVFDVTIENTKALNNYDIFKKAGANTATTESASVNVTDGTLNIYFSSLAADGGANSPMISAIEIIRTSTNLAPVANAGADKTITLPVTTTTLDGAGTDADGTISAFAWTQVSGPNTAAFSSKGVAVPSLSGLITGNYIFSLIVTDNQIAASAADQVTVTVNSAGGSPAYRINAGGSQVTNSMGVFAADELYSPTPGNIASTTADIDGTTDDAIYQSVRYGATGTLNYAFPVSNGQYSVILHFAEIYFTSSSSRVFDVTLENTKVLDNYDIFKKAGANTATTESASINVTDGTLNIYFSSLAADGGTNSPMVCAIEIIKTSGLRIIGTEASSGNGTATATNEAVTALTALNGPATDIANITKAYPNPFSENLKIQFSNTTSASKVIVGIYDMTGRTIQQQYFGNTSAGVNTLNINLNSQMMPGIYLVRLDVDGKPVKLWKMVKEKK